MAKGVSKQRKKDYIGKHVVVRKQDGSTVAGKLVAVRGNTVVLRDSRGKVVKTKAFFPFFGAGFGFGFPGFFPGFGFGFPGFFW
ncbi:hypothetical protein [Paenibacillus thermotolerans]|uniref:hypothetical protein n=1 Tax=Paenibacillus thermotolerans TaxID=3027807 RepID=UPI002368620C|nr:MULTISPECIES: hypothetical protein [unclassified Paenibacillus]